MNAVVIEHVPLDQLPEAWRARLAPHQAERVTVRIEAEFESPDMPVTMEGDSGIDDPAFGIWRDRDDLADVTAHVRDLRTGRYGSDGRRRT
ncbi:hypothetical protein [Sphaerotilus mobilis]|uniref:Uncharacterized protein n=1 Tax=Sphaerotilus mobilis TaxID=47994 RepID=A0A4Q7LW84_9BURK|nr:hypothetical protein [Sphaerotilus mobilis]RZS58737.1 hypothetical protein EV685_1035 [Sphaerotilus mobilis]